MSNTTKAKTTTQTAAQTTTQTKSNAANAAKEFEVLLTTNNKSLQEAFLSGTAAAENAFKTSSEAFRTSYEKSVKDSKSHVEKATQSMSDAPLYDKDGAEDLLKVSNAVTEKSEKISAEILDFGTESVTAYFTAARSVIEADDAQKAFTLQSDYARASAETFVNEASKLNAMFVDVTKTLMAPFGSQYATSMDKFLNRS